MISDFNEYLQSVLPPVETFLPGHEPTYYGAAGSLARRLGMEGAELSGCYHWKHGCSYSDPWHPALLVRYPDLGGRILVPRKEDQKYLEEVGYLNVYTVGLPIIYTKPSGVARIENSIVLFPPHSTLQSRHGAIDAEFLKWGASLLGRFKHVYVCVSGSCLAHGIHVDEITDAGLSWVEGASINDMNALQRMRVIFETFEFVSANARGSCIAYAALFGARPSLAGPLVSPSRHSLEKELLFQEHPELIRPEGYEIVFEIWRERFPWMFVDPWRAHERIEDGRELTGWYNKIPDEQLARLLGLFDKATVKQT